MDAITWEQAHARIQQRGLPAVVLDAFEAKPVPAVLRWEMRDCRELFDDDVDYASYPEGTIVPLWTDHTGTVVVGLRERGEPRGFLRFSLEVGGDAGLYDEGLSWQQIVVRDLITFWERADDDDAGNAAVREAATHLGFQHLDRLLPALRDPKRRGDFETWRRELVRSIGG